MLRLAMIRARKSGSAVVDVGGGQNAAFMAAVREAKGSEARFDLVLSVVTGKVKMDKVLEIHEELILTSIEPSKIVVVINRVARDDSSWERDGSYVFTALPNSAPSRRARSRRRVSAAGTAARA